MTDSNSNSKNNITNWPGLSLSASTDQFFATCILKPSMTTEILYKDNKFAPKKFIIYSKRHTYAKLPKGNQRFRILSCLNSSPEKTHKVP